MKANRLSLLLAAMLAPCCLAQAQSTAAMPPSSQKSAEATASPKPSNQEPVTARTPAPLSLKDVAPASTESAARALVERKDKAKPQAESRDKSRTPGPAVGDDAVIEFHAVSPGTQVRTGSADSKGSHDGVGRVHGELYSAAGDGGHATAESVGVTSKDRKTSVYVGGNQIHSEPSHSH